MGRSHGPFHRACCWCGEKFLARNPKDICCSLSCYEEVYQQGIELQAKQAEFRILNEEVQVLQEGIALVHVRIVQQTRTLRLLGAQWTAASDTEREKIERRERSVATKLSKLNRNLEKRDKKALPLERDLFKLEREVDYLKKIVGDASSSND